MLDENGIKRFTYDSISPLTGLPTGCTGRRTNWEIVSKICKLEKNVFLQKCEEILKKIWLKLAFPKIINYLSRP